jgi:hypothetical protein
MRSRRRRTFHGARWCPLAGALVPDRLRVLLLPVPARPALRGAAGGSASSAVYAYAKSAPDRATATERRRTPSTERLGIRLRTDGDRQRRRDGGPARPGSAPRFMPNRSAHRSRARLRARRRARSQRQACARRSAPRRRGTARRESLGALSSLGCATTPRRPPFATTGRRSMPTACESTTSSATASTRGRED